MCIHTLYFNSLSILLNKFVNNITKHYCIVYSMRRSTNRKQNVITAIDRLLVNSNIHHNPYHPSSRSVIV